MRKHLFTALKYFAISALFCASFVVFCQKTTAAPAINRAINYQGRLLDSNGVPVSDGSYSIKFSLYDAASGGNRVWSASGTTAVPIAVSVTVTNGLFSYNLGDTSTGQNAFDINWHQDSLYLGVTIAADSEMTPRKRLTAVPYAFTAETLQGQYASSSVAAAGGNLFALGQHSADDAVADRTALYIQTSGTSNNFDYLIKGNSGSDVFTVSRQGNVTTTGNFAVNGNSIIGDSSSDFLAVNARINSDLIPLSNNTFSLGSSSLGWKNIYASSTLVIGGSLGAAGNAISPAITNFLDIGSETSRWNRVHAVDLYISGVTVLGSYSIAAASTSQSIVASVSNVGDAAFYGKEFLFSGSTPGIGAQTLSIIESPTSTLKVTNGSSDGGFGNLAAGNIFATGSVTSTYFAITNVNSNLIPLLNNTYDIGSGALSWKDIYASGTAYLKFLGAVSTTGNISPTVNSSFNIGSGNFYYNGIYGNQLVAITGVVTPTIVRGGSSVGINLAADGVYIMPDSAVSRWQFTSSTFNPMRNNGDDIGTSVSSVRSIYASSTVHAGGVTSTGNINPFANNAYDIGSAALSWKDVYASGTVNVGTRVIAGAGTVGAPSFSFLGDTGTGMYSNSAGYITFTSNGAIGFIVLPGQTLTYGSNNPSANNLRDLGGASISWKDIYASGTARIGTDVVVGGQSVCLADGTNCPTGATSDINWTYNLASDFVYNTTATTDLVLGSTATSTGAPVYFDLSGGINGTSTFYFGHATNANVVIGGTSTTQTGLNSLFVMNGNDLFASGNIGSASSVYTNGAFIAGSGSTYYGNGYINKNDGNLTINASGGFITPSTDLAVSLGSNSLRYNGVFGNTTSTNATTTNLATTNLVASGRSAFGSTANFNTGRIFDMSETISDFSGATHWRFLNNDYIVSSTASMAGKDVYAQITDFTTPAENTEDYYILGGVGINLVHQGSGDVSILGSVNFFAGNEGSGTVDEVRGIGGSAIHHGSGTTTNQFGLKIQTGIYNHGTGHLVNDYSIFVQSPTSSGIMNNHYGIYLMDQATGTIAFSIYSAGGDVSLNSGDLITEDILPTSTNAWDLGSGAKSWKDIYASGTAYLFNVTSTNVTSTNLFVNTLAQLPSNTTINSQSVCLADGTNCPTGASLWSYDSTSDFIYNTSVSSDLVLGSTATSTGAPAYFDLSGGTNGTSTFYFGHATNANVVIGGTSTTQTGLNSLFTMNGNDLFVQGNIGSASSVYTNGAFIAGSESTSTYYGNGFITKTDGALTMASTGGNLTLKTLTSGDLILTPASGIVVVGTGTALRNNDVAGTASYYMDVSNLIVRRGDGSIAGGNLTVNGNALLANYNGSVSIATSTLNGKLTVAGNSMLIGNVLPGSSTYSNMYDLGSSSAAWKSIFASSTVHAGGVTSTGNINPYTNNTYDIGAYGSAWKDIYASGTSYLTIINAATGTTAVPSYSFSAYPNAGMSFDGTWLSLSTAGALQFACNTTDCSMSNNLYMSGIVYPSANNTYALGQWGNAWSNIYASGTAYLAGVIATNVTSTNFTATNATTTNLYVATLAQLPTNTTINSQSVCLADGTNCPTGASLWSYNSASDFIYNTSVSSDLVLGSAATSTGAPAYFDLSGGTNGTSTFYFGHATNANVVIGGTSTTQTGLNSLFVINGNDLFVSGNIGSASSVYTNGAFIAGSGSTYYGNGYINKNDGNLTIDASGGFITPSTDLAVSLGSNSLRYNGVFGNVTSTNFFATSGTISNLTLTNVTSTNLSVSNINSDLIPLINNTYNIGSGTLSWKDIYASGTARLANVTSTNVTTTNLFVTNVRSDLVPSANNTFNIGSGALTFNSGYFNLIVANSQVVTPQITRGGGATGIIFNPTTLDMVSGSGTPSWRFDTAAFYPIYNNLLDVGTPTYAIRSIYASSTVHAGGVTSTGNVNPFASNTYDIGSSALSWKNVYASGTLIIGGGLGPAVSAVSPAVSTYLDLGSETLRWNRLHTWDIFLSGSSVLTGGSLAGASTTKVISSSLSDIGDQAFLNREYIFTGAIAGLSAKTLSLIESTTGTLKVTNGSTDGGFGSIEAKNINAIGSVTSTYFAVTNINSDLIPLANNTYDIGSASLSWQDIYASGTAYVGTDVVVGGQSVCLADGTNCQSSAATTTNWYYDLATDTVRNATATTDIIIGSAATSTGAPVYFDLSGGTSGTSTVYFGFATNTNVVIGGTSTTQTGLNSLFTMNGNDLFVSGNIGSASSVYTNGAFITGSGSTYFGDGFITKNDGSISVSSSGNITFLMNDFVGIGTSTPSEKLTVVGNIQNTLVSGQSFTTVSTTVAGDGPQNVFVQGKYAYVVNDGTVDRLTIYDVSDPQNPTSTGFANTSSSPSEVFVAGRYAYVVASEDNGSINIFDVSNPSSPIEVASLAITARTTVYGSDHPDQRPAIYVSGMRAYITDGGAAGTTFTVVDVSDPTNPFVLSTTNVGDRLTDVFVSGRYAYITSWGSVGSKNFFILDISTSTPSLVGSIYTGSDGGPFGVYVQGRYAYVANEWTHVFSVIDVSNPASPILKNEIVLSGGDIRPSGVSVNGRYAYVSNYHTTNGNSVSVIDIASSTNPIELTKISLGSDTRPSDVFTSGRYLYVTEEGSDRLSIIDIKGIETNGITAGSAEFGTFQVRSNGIINNDLTVAGALNVGIGGIITNGTLTVSGTTSTFIGGVSTTRGVFTESIIVNSPVFTVGQNVGVGTSAPTEMLTVVGNVQNTLVSGQSFTTASTTVTDDAPQNVFVQGKYAYVVSLNDSKLRIFDVSDPQNPTSTGFVNTSSSPSEVFVAGRYAYVVAANRLNIFDVSNNSSPNEIASLAVTAGSNSWGTEPPQRPAIYVSGKRAYITDGTDPSAFTVVDVSNPVKPSVLSTISIGRSLTDVFVSGRYAYVTSWYRPDSSNNFYILDISSDTPSVVSLTNSIGGTTDGTPNAVYVQGRYAYVTNGYNSDNLSIIDISNPAYPVVKQVVGVGDAPTGVSVNGRYAYVANYALAGTQGSISIVDVASSTAASVVATLNTGIGSQPFDVFTSGRYLYVTQEGDDKLSIIDIKGIETNGLTAASAEFGTMQIRSNGSVSNDFTIAGALNVGIGGIITNGTLTVSGSTSTFIGGVSSTRGEFSLGLTVGGTSVCLADGTNCPTGATSDINWRYNLANDYIYPATNTSSFVLGASTPETSPFYFRIQSTSSRLILGGYGSSTDIVLGATTSSGMNSLFQLTGDDIFLTGNIGSASSVYTNGAFIAGSGSTYYGNGYINKNDGNLTIDASGGFITPSTDLAVSLGSNSLRYNGVFGNVTSTNFFATSGTISNLTLTNVTSTNLSVSNINSDLIPLINNTYNIGSGTLSWKDIYASGTSYLGGGATKAQPTIRTTATSTFVSGLSNVGTAFVLDTANTISYPSKLLSIRHNGTEKAYFDINGSGVFGGTITFDAANSRLIAGSGYNVFLSGSVPGEGSTFRANSAASVPVTITGVANQTGDLQRWSTNAGGLVSSIDNLGRFHTSGTVFVDVNNTYDIGTTSSSWRNIYASGTAYISTNVVVGGQSVCLADGTNCPTGASLWSYNSASDFIYNTSVASDLVLGSSATSTGAPAYFDLSGGTKGTSTFYFGHATNANVVIGGTSTTQTGLNSLFVMNGNDLFVQGNIGSASSVYTNGAFIAGSASTYYGDGYISRTNGAITITANNGSLILQNPGGSGSITLGGSSSEQVTFPAGIASNFLPSTDSSYLLGNSTYRWLGLNAVNVTSTNATTTNLAFTSASGSSLLLGGQSVCLANGTNCPAGAIIWSYNKASDFNYNTTATTDLVLGSSATSTGAPAYFDLSGGTKGTSTFYFGHATNANVVIGGTSTTQTGLNSLFVMNGNDLFVSGNIGSASSVYTNGAFVAGSGSTYYGDGYVTKTNGAMTITATNGSLVLQQPGGIGSITLGGSSSERVTFPALVASDILPLDNSYLLGNTSYRWKGLDAVSATTTYATTTNLYASQLTVAGNIQNTLVSGQSFTTVATMVAEDGPQNVFVQGKYAYVVNDGAAAFDQLTIYDVSDPQYPKNVGFANTSSSPSDVFIAGRYAYVVAFNRLNIFDVSNPASPQPLSSLAVSASTTLDASSPARKPAIYVSGNRAFITDASHTSKLFTVVDVSNPTNPKIDSTSQVSSATQLSDVFIAGRYAYVTAFVGDSSNKNVFVLDVSTSTPSIIGSVNIGNYGPAGIYVQGRYAYITGDTNGSRFFVVDLSNPTAPTLVTSIVIGDYPVGVSVNGRYAYVANYKNSGDGNSVSVIDVASSTNPIELTRIALGASTQPSHLFSSGRYLYVAQEADDKLRIIDTKGIETNGLVAASAEVGNLQVRGNGIVNNDFTIAGALNVGIGGIISNGSLTVSGSTSTFISAVSSSRGIISDYFAVRNDVLYAGNNVGIGTASPSEKLTVVGNVQNTLVSGQSFTIASTVSASDQPQNVQVQGRYAYVVTDAVYGGTSGTLMIFDVSDPQNPVSVGTVTSTDLAEVSELAVAGRYAYVLATNKLTIFDISNPNSPSKISTLAVTAVTTWEATDSVYARPAIYVSGNRAYITAADGNPSRFSVINISNPYAPSIISTSAVGYDLTDVFVAGRYAYLTSYNLKNSKNLFILDISTSTPFLVGSVEVDGDGTTDDRPWAVYVQGRYAYTANLHNSSISIIDVSNPASPVVKSETSLGGSSLPMGISVNGRYVYLANNGAGALGNSVSVFDASSPTSPTLISTISMPASAYPSDLFTAGRYLYVTNEGGDSLSIVDVKGIETNGLMAASAEFGTFQVRSNGVVNNDFTVNGALNVGIGGILTNGTLAGMYLNVASSVTSNLIPSVDNNFSLGSSSYRWDAQLETATATHIDAIDNNATVSGGAGQFFKVSAVSLPNRFGVIGLVTSTSAGLSSIPDVSAITLAGGNLKSAGGLFVNGYGDSSNAAVMALDYSSSTGGAAIIGYRNCGTSANGNIMVLGTNNNQAMSVRCNGTIYADNAFVSTPGDYAEFFPTDDVTISAGEVVAMTDVTATSVKRAMSGDREYTLGVISSNPIILGNAGPDGANMDNPNYKIVGLLGQLDVKVNDSNGAISAGDKLMAGDNGFAVKASGVGMIIGQAMESLASSTGMIKIYIDPQWSADGIFEAGDNTTNVTSLGIATAVTSTFDSNGLTFQGSAWDAASSTAITSSFTLVNDVISASSSLFTINGTAGNALLTISDVGSVSVTKDLSVGGRLYLGNKSTGEASTSTYIFIDDTLAPTSTYIATNADGWSTQSTYDYAERFASDDKLVPGDVVVADPNSVEKVKRSASKDDTILGIVSTKPGFITGAHATDTYPIALAGRVPTRVSTMNGAIKAGDQLAPSDQAGIAVKAVGSGSIIGIALESYDSPQEGLISVFVQPGWRGGEIVMQGNSISSVTYNTYTNPGISPRAGLAKIAAGSKEVNVTFPTLNNYPLITVTPYGLPTGQWGLMNVNDHGFTIVLMEAQTFDLDFAWKAEPSQDGGVMSFSDGTSAPYDPTTGKPIIQIEDMPTPDTPAETQEEPVNNDEASSTIESDQPVETTETATEPTDVPATSTGPGQAE